MPREARNIYNGNLYHVMTQGINKEDIFYNDTLKKIYIKLIFENAKKENVHIVAYCIMKNHAHLLLNITDVKNMSKFMKIVNMKFAMLYNEMEKRVGVVFRNRYESELIYDESYFYNCVNYIHNNPVKAKIVKEAKEYKFSSANNYSLEKALQNIKIRKNITESDMDDFIDVDKEEIIKEKIEKVIKEFCLGNNIQEISLEDRRMVKTLVHIIKEKTKAKNIVIAEKLGLSKSTIANYLKTSLSNKDGN